MARTLAKILDVPFSIADATALTEAGYVGEDVESILANLLQAADYDVERAERGIIYVDEVDKLSRRGDNASITRDVSGEGVQQALLKMLEGTVAGVPPKGGRKHPEQSLVQFDTRNVLFICGGAFDGLAPQIARRMSRGQIGFAAAGDLRQIDAADPTVFRHAEPDDLLRYGLIPELIGRLPVLTALDALTPPDLRRILTEPKNALVRQYQKLFAMDGVDLVLDDGALDAVVDQADATQDRRARLAVGPGAVHAGPDVRGARGPRRPGLPHLGRHHRRRRPARLRGPQGDGVASSERRETDGAPRWRNAAASRARAGAAV